MIGQKLRHYRIETKLGAGGMGIVYRARDTHLDRSIALKVLPASDISDPDRRSRLSQEARAASALNHPNIITIYDIGTDGSDDKRIDFIAMEFVQGKTLDRLIGRRGLKVAEALKYAIQIADAITAAHANGIIHRDLKPANLMVTDLGLVKVLDFGLAKAPDSSRADAFALTESVHLAPDPITETGTILGTVAYMSPEQAEGKCVDARSDIFSFGSVLYEMLTAARPFTGDSKLSVLATILQKEPKPLGDMVRGIPHELEKVINRCLQKDPQERWQTMADVKFALQDLLADVEANRASEAGGAAAVSPARRTVLWAATVGLIAAGIGGAYLESRLRHAGPVTYQRLTFRRGDVSCARFAPGGDTIVYSAAWDGQRNQIYTTIAGSHESRALDVPEGKLLSVSPTAELAFLRGANVPGILARMPLAGGAPRDALEDVTDADWGPDGSKLAVVRLTGGHCRLEYPVGAVLYESDRLPPRSPRVSPNGDLVAFYDYDSQTGNYGVAAVGPGTPKRMLSRGWRGTGDYLAWAPDGKEVWFASTHLSGDPMLRAVSLSGRERVVGQIPGWLGMQDIARDGRILAVSAITRVAIAFSAAGSNKEQDLSWLDTSRVFDLSDDAKQLLFVEFSYGEGQNTSIYLRKTDGSPAVLLGYGNHPDLSPNGKWVAAIASNASETSLILLPTGAGEQRNLTTRGLRYDYVEWFPSSDKVLFTATEAGGLPTTYVQDIAGGPPRAVTAAGIRGAVISRDGSALITIDHGHYSVSTLNGGKAHAIAGIQPGDRPLRWTADRGHIFLQRMADNGPRMQVYRLDLGTGKREFWKEMGPADPVGARMLSVAITPDGRSYAYSYQRDANNLYLVRGLK